MNVGENPNDMLSELDKYVQVSLATHSLRKNVIQSAIDALHIPQGSQGLDAGCGTGLPALMLAEVVGIEGFVTGLDISTENLDYAREFAKQAGLNNQVEFKEGDVADLPFSDNTFDWVWSCDCVGYTPLEPLSLVKELVRVVKPGGFAAILAWSSETLLPGYPQLEARLRGTNAGISPFVAGRNPEENFLRALGWFNESGLKNREALTFAGEVHAPLSAELRQAMIALFVMRWPGVKAELIPADWAEYDRLCNPDSSDFIVNHADYYAFFTYSMFTGIDPD
jgi:demethylmenaquinone methyltransferase/2-methoxy-6-polyprenyl-1,4-benzoquinol methylase